jgi:hypothetical protein
MVERTSDGAMLTTKSADLRLVLPRPFFADARFSGASLGDKPITIAFGGVASSVRLSASAFSATGSLRVVGFEVANIALTTLSGSALYSFVRLP